MLLLPSRDPEHRHAVLPDNCNKLSNKISLAFAFDARRGLKGGMVLEKGYRRGVRRALVRQPLVRVSLFNYEVGVVGKGYHGVLSFESSLTVIPKSERRHSRAVLLNSLPTRNRFGM